MSNAAREADRREDLPPADPRAYFPEVRREPKVDNIELLWINFLTEGMRMPLLGMLGISHPEFF
jgi:hypothetical protein